MMTTLFGIPVVELLTALMFIIILVSLYKAHRDPQNNFNLFDILMENGRVSKVSVIVMGTWAAMTYVFIGTYVKGTMTEGLFMSFGTICFAPMIAKMFSSPAAQPSKGDTP